MYIIHPEGSVECEIERKRMDFVSKILMIGSDIQTTLGIAYMVTVFSQISIMSTYHLHLVFDIVSFVGISNTAALVCWRFCRAKIDDPDIERHSMNPLKRLYFRGRYRAAYLYIYVAVTSSWLMAVILAGVFGGVSRRRWILIPSSLHFPLHFYMAIALRQANQGKFEGETKHENEWDFGQTTAVLLLGIAVVELFDHGKKYYDFEKNVAKSGISRRSSERPLQEAEEANNNGYLLATPPRDEYTLEEGRPAVKGCTAG